MIIKKLKAGALQMVLYISVIIAIMLAAFILLVHTQNMFKAKTNMVRQTVLNANNNIYEFLDNETNIVTDSLNVNYWGVYKKVSITTQKKNITIKKSALTGGITNRNEALFLKDNNKPLVVVGNSQISGKAYVPERGIKSGQIAGKSYYGPDLKYGDFITNKEHPTIAPDLKNHLTKLIEIDSLLNLSEVLEYKTDELYTRSFQDSPQLLYGSGKIVLSNTKITGHHIVVSEEIIEVEASSKLNDVILVAPKIIIKDGAKGAFQAVASKYLEVGRNCQLSYPSALVLVQTNNRINPKEISQIVIGGHSEIKGVILHTQNSKGTSFLPNVYISETSEIYGEVYCEPNLDLRGTVYGSVITSSFIATHEGSVYQNHLFNGKILPEELPEQYVGLDYENRNKGVAKWLY